MITGLINVILVFGLIGWILYTIADLNNRMKK